MRSSSIVFLAFINLLICVSTALEANDIKTKAFRNLDKSHSLSHHQKDYSSLGAGERTNNEERVVIPVSENAVATVGLRAKSFKEPILAHNVDHVLNFMPVRDPTLARKEALSVIRQPKLIEALMRRSTKQSRIATLTSEFGDDIMAQVLVTARISDSELTRNTATGLLIDLLKLWDDQKKSISDVFGLLKLNGPDRHLAISDGRIAVLDSYITKLHSKSDPESINAILIKTLLDGYGGDDKFALVVGAALKDPDDSTWKAAFDLETKYLSTLWEENPSYKDLFLRLKLNDGPNKYLAVSDGRLALLEDYIKITSGEELSDTALIQTLLKGYGGDEKFALVVGAALKDSDKYTQRAAFELKVTYCKTLWNSGASYDDLFSKLKLNDGLVKYEAFTDGRITLLDEYIQFKSGEKESDYSLIQTLLKGYGGDDKFALFVSAAMESRHQATLVAAQELETKYFKTLLSEKVTTEGFVTRLKFEEEDVSTVDSLKKKMLERYAAFRSENDRVRVEA